MRQLLLLRHAKASWPDPLLPDHSRPLDPRGRTAVTAMRDALERLDLGCDLVLVSSARRTLQTLNGLLPWVADCAVEPMDALYLATAADMLTVLRQVTPVMHRVMLIGHNPGIHDLALLVSDADPRQSTAPGARQLSETFPTCGLAQLAVPRDWDDLAPGSATLLRFLTPSDLSGKK